MQGSTISRISLLPWILDQGTDFQGRVPRRRRTTGARLGVEPVSLCRDRYQCGDREPRAHAPLGGSRAPWSAGSNGPGMAESSHWLRNWEGGGSGGEGSSEVKRNVRGDVQVSRESGAGQIDATGITSFPVDKKTRPHKAAGMVDAGMSLSILLQFRMRIAVGKSKLSFEIPSFIRTFKGK